MQTVISAGTARLVISGFVSDQIDAASAPTPIAPTVWAMVFRVRIAASGLSMLALNWRK